MITTSRVASDVVTLPLATGVATVGLLEREVEIDRMAAAVGSVAVGRGALVLVEGPPGDGRSALLRVSGSLGAAAGCAVLDLAPEEPLEPEEVRGRLCCSTDPAVDAGARPGRRRPRSHSDGHGSTRPGPS